MKRLILSDFMGDGAGRLFVRLLDDWGRWERSGTGIHGFSRGCLETPKFIDDDSALIVNRAYGRLCKREIKYANLIRLRYIVKLDTVDIVRLAERNIPAEMVIASLNEATKMLFNEIENVCRDLSITI